MPFSADGDLPPPNSLSLQAWLQTIAPLARSTGDLDMLVRAMAGPDQLDSHTVPFELGDPERVDVRGLGCAWFDGDGTIPVRSDVRATVATAAAALAGAGVRVVNERPSGFEEGEDAYAALRKAEGLPDHAVLTSGRDQDLAAYLRTWLTTSQRCASTEHSGPELTGYGRKSRLS